MPKVRPENQLGTNCAVRYRAVNIKYTKCLFGHPGGISTVCTDKCLQTQTILRLLWGKSQTKNPGLVGPITQVSHHQSLKYACWVGSLYGSRIILPEPFIMIISCFELTTKTMKTPERSHISRDPQLYSPFAQKSFCLLWIERHTQINYVMSRNVMTSYCHVIILSRHMKSHHRP